MADLFNQPLKTLLGLFDRIVSGVPGQSGADNILYPDLKQQIGNEIVPDAPQKTVIVDGDEIGLWDSEDSDLLKGVLVEDVEVYNRSKGGNIIANQGVDADASKPTSGLTIGDIFVSNDTFKKYTAIDATTFDAGVVLLLSQIITDSTTAENNRYQYNGITLLDFGSSGGGGHEYKENGIIQTPRAGRNIMTNGTKSVLSDDAPNDETDEKWYFEVSLDVDPTGKQDGDVWGYNVSTQKTEPVQTKPDRRLLPGVPEVINGLVDITHTLLSTIQEHGYAVNGYINNDSPVAITGLVITDGVNNLFTPIDFTPNQKGKKFTIPDSYFDPDDDKEFYYYVTTGNSANVTIYFTNTLNSPE